MPPRMRDWTTPQAALLVGLAGFLLRLPNTLAGIGFDSDSALYLKNALLSQKEGMYIPSRAPGYFVPDLIAQLLAGYGPQWLCILNSLLFTLTVPIFASILRQLNLSYRNWIIWTYTLFPVNWVATSDVMVEYSLSLLGILLGWLNTLRGNFWGAGVSLGWGAAMRPSQGVFVLGLFALYWLIVWGIRRSALASVFAVLILAVIWIIPVGVLTGWETIISYFPYEAPLLQGVLRAGGRVLSAFGFVGTVAFFVGVLFSLRTLVTNHRRPEPAWLSFAVFFILMLLFFRHPFKMNYLLLAIPFGLHVVSLHSNRILTSVICSALILHSFVGFPSVGLISTRHNFQWVGAGTGLRDWMERRGTVSQIERLLDAIPAEAVLVAQGSMIRRLEYESLRNSNSRFRFVEESVVIDPVHNRVFARAVTPEGIERIILKYKRDKMYITSGASFVLKRDHGYDTSKLGFQVIQVENVGL